MHIQTWTVKQIEGDECLNTENSAEKKEIKLDHEKALAYCGGSEDFLKEIFSMYVAEDKRDELKNAYASRDWEKYRALVHNVKSTSRTIGAMELGDMAQELENAVKARDEGLIHSRHQAVMDYYSAVLDWCRANGKTK